MDAYSPKVVEQNIPAPSAAIDPTPGMKFNYPPPIT